MPISVEAIVGLLGVFVGLPPAVLVVWRLFQQRALTANVLRDTGNDGMPQPNAAIPLVARAAPPEGREAPTSHDEGGGQGRQGQEPNEPATARSALPE